MTINNLHKVSDANLVLLLVKILPRTLQARSLAALVAGIAKYRLPILDNIILTKNDVFRETLNQLDKRERDTLTE